jgi:hypothetical protein
MRTTRRRSRVKRGTTVFTPTAREECVRFNRELLNVGSGT